MNIEHLESVLAVAVASADPMYLSEEAHKASLPILALLGLEARHSGGSAHWLRCYVATPAGRFVYHEPKAFCLLSREKREKKAVAALAADKEWEALVSTEVAKFTGDLDVTLN